MLGIGAPPVPQDPQSEDPTSRLKSRPDGFRRQTRQREIRLLAEGWQLAIPCFQLAIGNSLLGTNSDLILQVTTISP